ncbi:arabinogalactan protein 41-like [Wolffia australiana]
MASLSYSAIGSLIVAAFLAVAFPAVRAQAEAPAPLPTSDGISIDQGVAYVLMLVALVLTYLFHPLDAAEYKFF